MSSPWTLDTIPWSEFRADLVDPALLRVAKTAAMVEYNGGHYAGYLERVFAGDERFIEAAKEWGTEETRHGEALARWAKLADPDFDFQASFARFQQGYVAPLDGDVSVRGSRAGELIARCIVETGTSSFYTALNRASKEPVLASIAHWIAVDEFRHYKLFYDTLKTYLDKEGLGRLGRLKVAVGRIGETEDDELSYAYYAANIDPSLPYDRKACGDAYIGTVCRFYDEPIIRRGNAMILKAVGLPANGLLAKIATRIVGRVVKGKAARYERMQQAA